MKNEASGLVNKTAGRPCVPESLCMCSMGDRGALGDRLMLTYVSVKEKRAE